MPGLSRWGQGIFPRCTRWSSPIWRGILSLCPKFAESLGRRVANGESTAFWLDAWVDGSPLQLSFDRLFDVARDRDIRVRDCWVTDLGGGHWLIPFGRQLAGTECDDAERLALILQGKRLADFLADSPAWLPSGDGSFSVHWCYRWWRRNREPLPWAWMAKETWAPKVPLKVRVFFGSSLRTGF
ncbi:hypothetical protein QJS10_CPB17g01321 [Acorus calamus]|uniref:Reverse transcriptase zinc-binding domain-containing protein n=1 Tax=Acorus calamus TaxID=4465 RepID=A0AAV9CYC8_ACOCL|nr:hypothetical protein QJS10_CPB17g01321 [Acorus calamus]